MEPARWQPPEASRCAFHPELAAAITCARCGTFACSGCYQLASDSNAYCVSCMRLAKPALAAGLPLADRGSRFLANLVDQALVLLPPLIMGGIAGVVAGSRGGSRADETALIVIAVVALGLLALTVGVQLVFLSRYGQSVGKRMLKIRVVRTDGSPVSLGRLIFLRNAVPQIIASVVGAVVPCAGLLGLADALWIFGAEQRCLHDYLADTAVVQAR